MDGNPAVCVDQFLGRRIGRSGARPDHPLLTVVISRYVRNLQVPEWSIEVLQGRGDKSALLDFFAEVLRKFVQTIGFRIVDPRWDYHHLDGTLIARLFDLRLIQSGNDSHHAIDIL